MRLRRIIVVLILVALLSGVECVSADGDDIPRIVVDEKGIPMIQVIGDTFEMGSNLENAIETCSGLVPEEFVSQRCSEDTFEEFQRVLPPQEITIENYYIDFYEVSLRSYLECVNADVCNDTFLTQELEAISSGDNISQDVPVTGASYYDAAIYCAWRQARLPSEIEWEFAASGLENFVFPWGNEFDGSRVNFCDTNCPFVNVANTVWDDEFSQIAPVDSFQSGTSWLGLFNMSGNVAEWTSTIVTTENEATESRVVKGGSYLSFGDELTTWSRLVLVALANLDEIGFRCARTFLENQRYLGEPDAWLKYVTTPMPDNRHWGRSRNYGVGVADGLYDIRHSWLSW